MATSKEELLTNARHWLGEAKRNGLKQYGIGAIFVFFDETGEGSAVCAASVDKRRLAAELRTILKKLDERVIISPWEN